MTLDLASRILYRDGLVLIIDKPAGIPVHAGPGGGPNLEAGFDALRFGLPHPPALAHRLDRDTSGCLALGRHRKALSRLGRLFQEGRVGKTYWAVLKGIPEARSGRIELALSKQTRSTGWRIVADPAGQVAVTDYEVMGTRDGIAWVAFHPHTGRTHQIRVHAATALACPVLGDPHYGDGVGSLHLHSRELVLPLYPKKEAIKAVAPIPAHMRNALIACGCDLRDEACVGE